MSRHLLADPKLRPLIDRVAALAIEAGSVNRLQKQLAEVLASDRSEGWLYPNRLHTLLSEDPGKGVNTETIDVLERALARLGDSPEPSHSGRADELRQQAVRLWSAAPEPPDLMRLRALGERLGLPPAAVRLLLDQSEVVGHATTGTAARTRRPPHEPDWSFQDDAYSACISRLTANAGAKVGLVLPTGAGKTRVATRISLKILQESASQAVCLWVTHRSHLKQQALRELQRALAAGTPDLPDDAIPLLGARMEVCMLAELRSRLDALGDRVALVVVDEAHHAAAASYQPLFERPGALRGLFLTATPNRMDKLPIGIDDIAYTITYRQLFDRGVIVEPQLEELTIEGFDWSADTLRDLADYLLVQADADFAKTLVVTSRIDHVTALHEVLVEHLAEHPNHLLTEEDIAFVHGSESSSGASPQAFLDEFAGRPRGILIATSNLLGEGYDDPTVDAVVVTYATGSLIQLMQAAGRCMRYAPGKTRATVVQLKESPLAYHWEQRWLYQDISDALRPRLDDVTYANHAELVAAIDDELARHRVRPSVANRVRAQLAGARPGERVALLLTGLPYDGSRDRFEFDAAWGAVLVTERTRDLFVRTFNDFSARMADVNSFDDFLRNYVDPTDSLWYPFKDMLWAMSYAAREISEQPYVGRGHRPATDHGTTWLTYVTFEYAPALPAALADFLADAVNGEEISTEYVRARTSWTRAAKLPLPLGGTVAFLLDVEQEAWLEDAIREVTARILDGAPAEAFGIAAAWRVGLGAVPVPQLLVARIEALLAESGRRELLLALEPAAGERPVARSAAAETPRASAHLPATSASGSC